MVLKWLQPQTSEAASLYVPSPDPAPLTASASGPRPTRLAEQALASAPNLGATVISFRRSPGGVPLANPTTEASGSDQSPAKPTIGGGGETDALVIATQKLQEAQREIDDMRRDLAQAEWDLTLSRQQAASGIAERDRSRQEVKDLTQQLRQNFLDLNAAQDRARTQQHDARTEQDRLKQFSKLQNACQNQTTRAAN